MNKIYNWYGVTVRIVNIRRCNVTGLSMCDLTPVIGTFPERFYPAKMNVPIALLKEN